MQISKIYIICLWGQVTSIPGSLYIKKWEKIYTLYLVHSKDKFVITFQAWLSKVGTDSRYKMKVRYINKRKIYLYKAKKIL